jgi:hypothetical protein
MLVRPAQPDRHRQAADRGRQKRSRAQRRRGLVVLRIEADEFGLI